LQDAYERGELRGCELQIARHLLHRRKQLGRWDGKNSPRTQPNLSPSSLVRAYQREVQRQQLLVCKASYAHEKVLFIVEALRLLYADEGFGNLLRGEGLDGLPQFIADRVAVTGGAN